MGIETLAKTKSTSGCTYPQRGATTSESRDKFPASIYLKDLNENLRLVESLAHHDVH